MINLVWIEILRTGMEPVHKNTHTHTLRSVHGTEAKSLVLGTKRNRVNH